MRWIVEITSVADEDALRRILAHLGGQVVNAATIPRGLWFPEFEAYSAMDQVCAHVTRIRECLDRFAELAEGPRIALVLGDVYEALGGGSYKRCMVLHGLTTTIHAQLTGEMSVRYALHTSVSAAELQRRQQEAAERDEQQARQKAILLAAEALRDPRVLQVLEMLKVEAPNPTQLGHIVDLVRDACNGDLSAYASNNEVTRFERSINHPRVMGLDARHATSRQQPPPKPMTLQEATSFAHRLARRWIDA